MIKQQQGIALITILVMVALATILAATIAQRQAATAESTAYLMRQNQSSHVCQECRGLFFLNCWSMMLKMLQRSIICRKTWAQPMPAFPVDDGYVSGIVQDESGKF